MMPGNGKGHGDPPEGFRLRRLLCCSPAVWRELRELVRGQEKGLPAGGCSESSDAAKVLPEAPEELEISSEEGMQLEDRYAMGIEILNSPKPSWMDAPWSKILDHQDLWEDPSPEVQRVLKKLLGRG